MREFFGFAITSRDNSRETFRRGKLMLGYSDSELAALGGYDLVHYDDLSYISSAHQERKLCNLYFGSKN